MKKIKYNSLFIIIFLFLFICIILPNSHMLCKIFEHVETITYQDLLLKIIETPKWRDLYYFSILLAFLSFMNYLRALLKKEYQCILCHMTKSIPVIKDKYDKLTKQNPKKNKEAEDLLKEFEDKIFKFKENIDLKQLIVFVTITFFLIFFLYPYYFNGTFSGFSLKIYIVVILSIIYSLLIEVIIYFNDQKILNSYNKIIPKGKI